MDTNNVLYKARKKIFSANTLFYSSIFYGTIGGTITWNLNHLTNGFFYLSIQTIISSAITLIPYFFIRHAILNSPKFAPNSLDKHHFFYLARLVDIILFLTMPMTSSLIASVLFNIKLLSILNCQLLGQGVIFGLGMILDATFTFLNVYQNKLKNLELLNVESQKTLYTS